MLNWTDPVSYIHGLTAQQRRVLKNLDVENVEQILSILPRRYDDYSRVVPVAEIPIGEPVTVKVRVVSLKKQPTFRKKIAIIRGVLEDGTGTVAATWFNQPWMLEKVKPGDELFVSGVVRRHPRFGTSFASPLWEPANEETLAAGNLAPVYPLIGQVTQKTLRKIMKTALDDLDKVPDAVPEKILKKALQPSMEQAVDFVHRPQSLEEAERGRRRFVFNEIFFYHLALRMAREKADQGGAQEIPFEEGFAKKFSAGLPFELTADQKRAVWAVIKDMERERPMRRLVQGDVGSGKTVVAAFCSAMVARAGFSAAMMAPTEILAKQHAETLRRLLTPFHIPVLLITSSARTIAEGSEIKSLKPEEARVRLAKGRVMAVGTHALLERGQCPPDLALAIVDEQHRFGVTQREALTVVERPDGKVPHLMSMTATPIPRSLTLTILGDLDVSCIHTKPAGRLPIKTRAVTGDTGRNEAYRAVLEAVKKKEQAFVVCPLIDPSDKLGAKSVEDEARRLRSGVLRDVRLAILHGKLSPAEKDQVMQDVQDRKVDVLIATTVVEVGVDIPNATVMCIESAERFGLAQLHQLRGRIGRSDKPCHCFLIAGDADANMNRLQVLEQTNDGFQIAEADLKMRGQGNVFGTQQSGRSVFRHARPSEDLEVMMQAREMASACIKKDPELQKHPDLRQKVEQIRAVAHGE